MFNDPGLARMTRPASREGRVLELIAAIAIIAVLFFGREVFVPVALAILLSFVLSPVLRVLRRIRLPRTLSVVTVVLVTFLGLATLGAVVASQIAELAIDLPRYQANLQEKIRSFKGATAGSGSMERVANMLQDLSTELDRPQPAQTNALPAGVAVQKPIPVEIRQPEPGTLGMLGSVISPLIHPLATTGIIFIFLIFILLQREDLRNRFIRLAGAHDIQRTTAALDDAGGRLSRFLLTQVVLNAAFGAVIGLGLWLIGVPSAILWGLLAAVLRFVPYIGAIIAAVLPSALALAVDPGWAMVVSTVALFVVIEPVVGHIIEPLLYGRSTGLSPVAVIASATFWTWLWGPIGLVLATPLTLCLVVLGRHVDQLEFLDVMFGDRPPLSAPELFYQRMLAGDPIEATTKAEEYLKQQPLLAYVDEVALPALRLAQRDATRGALDVERIERIRVSVGELVDNLTPGDEAVPPATRQGSGDMEPATTAPQRRTYARLDRSTLPAAWAAPTPVLCISASSGLDEAAALLLSLVFTAYGLTTRVEGPERLQRTNLATLDHPELALIVVSSLDGGSAAHLRYSARRLRRRLPNVPILLGAWGLSEDRVARSALEEAGDAGATSIEEALAAALAMAKSDRREAAGTAAARDASPAEITPAAADHALG